MEAALNKVSIFLQANGADDLILAFTGMPIRDRSVEGFLSIKGRLLCVVAIPRHLIQAVFKTIQYLALGIICTVLSLCSCCCLSNFRWGAIRYLICAGLYPISQVIQIVKATFGIFHPGIYFRYDLIDHYMKQLATIASQANLPLELVNELRKGSLSIRWSLFGFPGKANYLHRFEENLKVICDQMSTSDFPLQRKFALLSLLIPDQGGGLGHCAAGIGRLFEQIRYLVDIPEDPTEVLRYIADECKREILHAVIYANYRDSIINIDPAHTANTITLAVGREIGLPERMMTQAQLDPAQGSSWLSAENKAKLIADFRSRYTQRALLDAIQLRVNTSTVQEPENGGESIIPGLQPFRFHMVQVLSNAIPEASLVGTEFEGDPTRKVVHDYYLHQGELGETDFNDAGLLAFANTLGEKNPFQGLSS